MDQGQPGGGWPGTFQDASNALQAVPKVDTQNYLTILSIYVYLRQLQRPA